MELKKPPVVEAWIDFKFDLTNETVQWRDKDSEKFISTFCQGFKLESFLISKSFRIKDTQKTADVSEQLVRARAFTEDRQYCVQIGRDILVFNQLKIREQPWQSFQMLKDKAFEILNKFVEFRKINKFLSVVLHYHDIVEIPCPEKESIKLEDYFKVYPTCPSDNFGDMNSFRMCLGLPMKLPQTEMLLDIRPLKTTNDKEKNKIIFDLGWHITSSKMNDENSAKEWLEGAHKELETKFKDIFTQNGFKLFEPEGDENVSL